MVELEGYAVIGDTHSVALVGRNGSIDWLCLPRFDSGACFAGLLGAPGHGHFALAPRSDARVERRYRDDTLVLETDFRTSEGVVRLIDAMPVRDRHPQVVRVVEGITGAVPMRLELVMRFDYGRVVPWVRKLDDGRLLAIAGPDALVLATAMATRGKGLETVAEFTVHAGQRVPFSLSWHPSNEPPPPPPDATRVIEETTRWWRSWSARHAVSGRYRDAVARSLVTLKALTYAPTGGILAAGTTSLPERIGGVRNWDYRYCWLRDATFTLYALMHAGYTEEAGAWRDWLLRAVAGDPGDWQTVYGPAGERRLDERTLAWLPGYEGSSPVRIGNRATEQLQLDVYGEVLDALHQARRMGLSRNDDAWELQRLVGDWLESRWRDVDHGLWEVRGTPRPFVHSKMMAWTGLDRLVKAVEDHGLSGPVAEWRRTRAEIHDEVCRRGFNAALGSFTQSYDSDVLDASLLLMPTVGFLPHDDPRVRGTIAAIERSLVRDGFVLRYATDESSRNVDGLPGREGAFIACSFWMVDALVSIGRVDDARSMFDRILSVRNDVGLLSEEYDLERKRLVGNFPQAFAHVGIVNGAYMLEGGARISHRSRT
ncbi:MAG: glycoside hydrolase family 15 protein [Labilithrix sp.]|nr:glycoside hydrolase family 15 protein [Labilithrix sp.]